MVLGAGSAGVGLAAGALSILSPCVLPLIPIVIGTATASHRLGALALALGLALSFTAVGMFVATIGFAIGLDADWFRAIAAVMLILFGVILLSARMQQRFAGATAALSNLGNRWLETLGVGGLGGQFVVGLLLGMVWAPCVGPTLGAAATLASQGNNLTGVALVMVSFGLGAGLALGIIGSMSRRLMANARGNLLTVGVLGKHVLGTILIVVGISIIAGWDKSMETWLVAHSPAWLTALTTRF
ncbi:MAG: cytochrome c biogenesis CcdA family protein [Casimicrobiaceae bacterium]